MILYKKFKDRIERNSFAGTGGWIIGGAKGYVGPPSQIIGGAWPPLAPPLPTPMTIMVATHQRRNSSTMEENTIFTLEVASLI